MKQVLQAGREVSAAETTERWKNKAPRSLTGAGGARKAADSVAPETRRSRMEQVERDAVGYAKGGLVMTPKCTPYKAK